ncbi:hypothetical protein AB0K00_13585 [Dactylosporangium sp. NPDC049525]|uniref:hypothetical protein n=1 Tax=Dactylosporangium sp. NPDC049525 TaxID=3154730 RepID=UPI00344413AE
MYADHRVRIWRTLVLLAALTPFVLVLARSGVQVDVTHALALGGAVLIAWRADVLSRGGTIVVEDSYIPWMIRRFAGLLLALAVAPTPLGGWLAGLWRDVPALAGWTGAAVFAVVAVLGWLFRPGDQVVGNAGGPFGVLADLVIGPVFLVRWLLGKGLLPFLLAAVWHPDRRLLLAVLPMLALEVLLAMRTAVLAPRTTLLGLVSGRDPRY